MTHEQEELLKMNIRMNAMQAAIAFYCCQKGNAPGPDDSDDSDAPDEFYEPLEALSKLMEILIQIRDALLNAALNPGNDPI